MPRTGQGTGDALGGLDLDKFTVIQLKQFLKDRGLRSSGRKSELLKLAKLYANSPVLRGIEAESEEDIFASDELVWREVTSHSQIAIPLSFSIDVLTTYLSTLPAALVTPHVETYSDDDLEETEEGAGARVQVKVDAGTEKPSVKGRRMYCSEKLTLVEAANSGSEVFFRANCEASLRKDCRYPAVAIGPEGIVKGKCNCPANAGMLFAFKLNHN
jgi:hypothetical protein